MYNQSGSSHESLAVSCWDAVAWIGCTMVDGSIGAGFAANSSWARDADSAVIVLSLDKSIHLPSDAAQKEALAKSVPCRILSFKPHILRCISTWSRRIVCCYWSGTGFGGFVRLCVTAWRRRCADYSVLSLVSLFHYHSFFSDPFLLLNLPWFFLFY
jgi:hypothetical protein